VLEHFREEEIILHLFSIFGAFSSDRILKATKEVIVHFFIHNVTSRDDFLMENALTVKIPVNYTDEFWESFEATT